MFRRPPRATRTDTLFPYPTLFRSPAAAALSTGDGAEFVAPLAEPGAGGVVKLGRERPRSDAGRIGLGDAEHEADRARPQSRAARGGARNRVRRGDRKSTRLNSSH